jgi:type IV secretory pathway TrbD component
MAEPAFHPVYRSLNRPLTILGAERRLFFLALVMGGATFNFFGSLLTGLAMFGSLYVFARWATVADPQILRILLNSSKFRSRYDPAKIEPLQVVRIHGDPTESSH